MKLNRRDFLGGLLAVPVVAKLAGKSATQPRIKEVKTAERIPVFDSTGKPVMTVTIHGVGYVVEDFQTPARAP